MTDRKKVIRGLKCCLSLNRCPDECLECPYICDKDCEVTCMQNMGKDALELLNPEPIWVCRDCGAGLVYATDVKPWEYIHYCRNCGRKLDWEGMK